MAFVMPCLAANSSLHTMAAALPQVGGQAIRRVRWGYSSVAPITSSMVSGLVNSEYGLFTAWLRVFTATLAKMSGLAP